MSTKEGGPVSSAPQPEAIRATEDAGIDWSSSSSISAGGSGYSAGIMEPATPPVRRGPLNNWTGGESSPQAIDVFFQPSEPVQAHPRARAPSLSTNRPSVCLRLFSFLLGFVSGYGVRPRLAIYKFPVTPGEIATQLDCTISCMRVANDLGICWSRAERTVKVRRKQPPRINYPRSERHGTAVR